MVLARMTTAIEELPTVGASYVVTGQLNHLEGRKAQTSATLRDLDGLAERLRATDIQGGGVAPECLQGRTVLQCLIELKPVGQTQFALHTGVAVDAGLIVIEMHEQG